MEDSQCICSILKCTGAKLNPCEVKQYIAIRVQRFQLFDSRVEITCFKRIQRRLKSFAGNRGVDPEERKDE